MRLALACVLVVSACGQGKSTAPQSHVGTSSSSTSSGSGSPATSTKPTTAALKLELVTLLQPEFLITKRIKDQDELASSLKGVPQIVVDYDSNHAGVLPDSVDLVIVTRPKARRIWLVSANGDLSVPDLERAILAVSRFAVVESNVALVMSFGRDGAQATQRNPYMPAAWKAAAAGSGTDIDQVIDKAWPHDAR